MHVKDYLPVQSKCWDHNNSGKTSTFLKFLLHMDIQWRYILKMYLYNGWLKAQQVGEITNAFKPSFSTGKNEKNWHDRWPFKHHRGQPTPLHSEPLRHEHGSQCEILPLSTCYFYRLYFTARHAKFMPSNIFLTALLIFAWNLPLICVHTAAFPSRMRSHIISRDNMRSHERGGRGYPLLSTLSIFSSIFKFFLEKVWGSCLICLPFSSFGSIRSILENFLDKHSKVPITNMATTHNQCSNYPYLTWQLPITNMATTHSQRGNYPFQPTHSQCGNYP